MKLGGQAGGAGAVRRWANFATAAAIAWVAAGCGGTESSNDGPAGSPDSSADAQNEAGGSGSDGGTEGGGADAGQPSSADAAVPEDASSAEASGGSLIADSTAPSDSVAPTAEASPDAARDAPFETDAASVFSGTATYEVVNVGSGAALTVSGAGTVEGTLVVASASQNTTSQQWSFAYAGNGFYTAAGVGSGLLLGVNGPTSTDGTSIDIDDADNNEAIQQWMVTEESPGEYRLTPGNAPNSCAAPNASSGTADAAVVLQTYTGSPAQLWLLEPVTPGNPGHICTGTPAACGALSSESACNVSDCTWASACSGSPLPCSWHTGSADDCQAAGCN